MREARYFVQGGTLKRRNHVGTRLTRASKLSGKNSRTTTYDRGWKFSRYAEENILRWGNQILRKLIATT